MTVAQNLHSPIQNSRVILDNKIAKHKMANATKTVTLLSSAITGFSQHYLLLFVLCYCTKSCFGKGSNLKCLHLVLCQNVLLKFLGSHSSNLVVQCTHKKAQIYHEDQVSRSDWVEGYRLLLVTHPWCRRARSQCPPRNSGRRWRAGPRRASGCVDASSPQAIFGPSLPLWWEEVV